MGTYRGFTSFKRLNTYFSMLIHQLATVVRTVVANMRMAYAKSECLPISPYISTSHARPIVNIIGIDGQQR